MNYEIIQSPFNLNLYGFKGRTPEFDYSGKGMELMRKVAEFVQAGKFSNKGVNYWVYESCEDMFVGYEPVGNSAPDGALENLKISIPKFARHVYKGPYDKLGEVNERLQAIFRKEGVKFLYPCLEVYADFPEEGEDPVTELIYAIE